MTIAVRCPECGRPSSAPDGSAGKWARCKCGAKFRVPDEDPILATLRATFAGPAVDEGHDEGLAAVLFPPPPAAVKGRQQPAGDDPLAALGITLDAGPWRD